MSTNRKPCGHLPFFHSWKTSKKGRLDCCEPCYRRLLRGQAICELGEAEVLRNEAIKTTLISIKGKGGATRVTLGTPPTGYHWRRIWSNISKELYGERGGPAQWSYRFKAVDEPFEEGEEVCNAETLATRTS